jgi:inosine/xanthosine triphosphatase
VKIAIGSASPTEIEAVKEAWKVLAPGMPGDPSEQAAFLAYGVTADLPPLPLSVEDLVHGAQTRAENLILQLKRERAEADFYVGLQAGFHLVDSLGLRRLAFLESWAYVTDGHRGGFGHGVGLQIPHRILAPVIDRGVDLAIVLDRLSHELELAAGQGPWELLSRDILSARHTFVLALLTAFAPFYNEDLYRRPGE